MNSGLCIVPKNNVFFLKWVVEVWILPGVRCRVCAFNARNALEFLKDFRNSNSHYL